MKKLKLVGFYRELPHGLKSGPSLGDMISTYPQEEEMKIVSYLKQGLVIIACIGRATDILSEKEIVIGSPHILTDGEWAWPNDLAYYVETYHAKVPSAFIEYMKENNWVVPDNIETDEIEVKEGKVW